jgi:hypothetical protein
MVTYLLISRSFSGLRIVLKATDVSLKPPGSKESDSIFKMFFGAKNFLTFPKILQSLHFFNGFDTSWPFYRLRMILKATKWS